MQGSLEVEVILLTRGGGSMEDLWAFNDRALAQAIVECEIPVVAAIGHETDVTVAELVADVRAATPTQAAMRIAPDAAALDQQLRSLGRTLAFRCARVLRGGTDDLDALSRHLTSGQKLIVQRAASRLDRLGARLEHHRPASIYARRDARLDALATRLQAAMSRLIVDSGLDATVERLSRVVGAFLDRQDAALAAAARSLDLVGPSAVLQRGYSMTLRSDGSIVRAAADVSPGEHVQTRLADGSFGSVVQDGKGRHGPVLAPRSSTTPRRKPRDEGEQPGLFGG
jgi:exodeoxyribonuclease VII large subunit